MLERRHKNALRTMNSEKKRLPGREGAPRIPILVVWLLVIIAALGIWDLILDAAINESAIHIAIEIAFVLLCLASAAYLGAAWWRAERTLLRVRTALREKRDERDEWRRRADEARRGLGLAIEAQLDAWGLTPVEKETAMLVLRGFSHKEIAGLRDRSERTVRQHAVSVYKKSGLSGRAELSAFFLEDLLFAPDEGSTPQ
jgi:DNA-binding CsgD family transcriptional regulator